MTVTATTASSERCAEESDSDSLPRIAIPDPLPTQHPYLLLTPTGVEELRYKRDHTRWGKVGYLDLLRLANHHFCDGPADESSDWMMPAMPEPAMRGRHVFVCAWACAIIAHVDSEASCIQRAYNALIHAFETAGSIWWQPTAQRITVCLDGIWSYLDASQRERLAALIRSSLDACPHQQAHGNIGAGHRMAMLGMGLILKDRELIDAALHDAEHGLIHIIEDCVYADGYWREAASGYHNYAVLKLIEAAWMAEAAGIALKDVLGGKILRCSQAIFDLMDASRLMPDTGDSRDFTVGGFSNPTDCLASSRLQLELCTRLYGDATSGWALRQTSRETFDSFAYGLLDPPVEVPSCRSRCFPTGGVATLRSGEASTFWGSDNATAFLRFGPHGGWHGHRDALSLEYRALKSRLIGEHGRAQFYADPSHNGFFRNTLAHSTVVVDRCSQAESRGSDVESFVQSSLVSAVCVANPHLYDQVHCRRALVMTDAYLIDAFDVDASGEHLYHYVLHGGRSTAAKAQTCAFGQDLDWTPLDGFGSGDGYGFLAVPRETALPLDGRVRMDLGNAKGDEFQSVPVGVDIAFLSPGQGRLVTAMVPSLQALGFGACLILEVTAREQRFLAVMKPGRGMSTDWQTRDRSQGRALCVEVKHAEGRDLVVWSPGHGTEIETNEVRFAGTFLFLRQDAAGQVKQAVLRNAKQLTVQGRTILDQTESQDLEF